MGGRERRLSWISAARRCSRLALAPSRRDSLVRTRNRSETSTSTYRSPYTRASEPAPPLRAPSRPPRFALLLTLISRPLRSAQRSPRAQERRPEAQGRQVGPRPRHHQPQVSCCSRRSRPDPRELHSPSSSRTPRELQADSSISSHAEHVDDRGRPLVRHAGERP